MDVVVVGVAVPNRNPRRVIGELHLSEEIVGNGIPLLSAQQLTGRQRKRRVPQVLLDVRAQRSHGGQLAGQLRRPGAGQGAADDLRAFLPRGLRALIEQVPHEAGSTAAAPYSRFHALPPALSSGASGSSWSRRPNSSRRSACTCSRSSAASAGGMPWALPISMATA